MNRTPMSPLFEALQAVEDDNTYFSGGYLYKSTATSGPVLEMIRAAEELAALIKRIDGPLFQIFKTSQGTFQGKHHEKASLFYRFAQSRILLSPALDPSESLHVLRSIWGEIIPNHIPLTGNIAARVGGRDVWEGELINTYAARCRDILRGKRYRERLRERRQFVSSLIAKTKRYIERLAQVHCNAHVSRFDLGHQAGERQAHDLETADRLLREFIRELMGSSDTHAPLGYLFKREFVAEIGYRTHLILFSDLGSTSPTNTALRVEDLWKKAAGERASAFDYAQLDANYRSWGCGPLAWSRPGLVEGLRRLLQRDLYLRLAPDERFVHFGLGELPKAPRDQSATTPAGTGSAPFVIAGLGII